MSDKQQQYEMIQRYLRNELSDAERKTFNTQLANDKDLQEEVELQKEVEASIGDSKYFRMQSIMKDIVNPSTADNKNIGLQNRRLSLWYLGMAVLIILLLSIGMIVYFQS